jgi:hypothetical protein
MMLLLTPGLWMLWTRKERLSMVTMPLPMLGLLMPKTSEGDQGELERQFENNGSTSRVAGLSSIIALNSGKCW